MWTSVAPVLLLSAAAAAAAAASRPPDVAAASARLLLRDAYPVWQPRSAPRDSGRRLLLTPLLEAGLDAAARRLCQVRGDRFPADTPSYSGFLTVDKQRDAHLFFWFFPAKSRVEESPIVLWLQGGPGASSLFGLFTEMGPFSVVNNGTTLRPNPHSWHHGHSLLFIDNPVGTGFSFTDRDDGYATDMPQVGEDLYEALQQFFTLFPGLRERPFFVAGESFAGKYIPVVGYTILERNKVAYEPINLQGVLIGNGFFDPEHMQAYSELSYAMGLVDHRVREEMRRSQEATVAAIRAGNLEEAYVAWVQTLTLLSVNSRHLSLYHLLRESELSLYGDGTFADFLQSADVRRAIHVGDAEFSSVGQVYAKMVPRFMSTARHWLEHLLDSGIRVLCYSGQLDLIVAYALSADAFRHLQWQHAAQYREADRQPWYVGSSLAGYMKTGGNLTELLVRGAGHMVPTDKPEFALQMVTDFTRGRLP
ncbi:venom serine carboxypeptidase-like [Schistocerca americana]|uniref:venom serine carboxypeptidase-like n=1 Tax=Schistocerca americana TaxID=7009 RepID=UPI001F4FED40|nr:venom serine carboxypeptidase-like [Schistocerca americana]